MNIWDIYALRYGGALMHGCLSSHSEYSRTLAAKQRAKNEIESGTELPETKKIIQISLYRFSTQGRDSSRLAP